MPSAHLISLGCSKNLIDSEHMLGILSKKRVSYSPALDGSDFVIVNTCGFLQAAVEESLEVIHEMLKKKKAGVLKRVVVSGCLPQRLGQELKSQLPEVDLFLGTGNFHLLGDWLDHMGGPASAETWQQPLISDPDDLKSYETPREMATLAHTRFVKISEGCSRKCSFCIIPKLRGKHRSRPIADIYREVRHLVSQGAREISLVAQDLTAYGFDLNGKPRLEHLLDALEEITDLNWIRLHYAYPYGFTEGLVDHLKKDSKVLPYLDMPLQHIDDQVLRNMRRHTRENSVRELLANLKSEISNLTLRTTLIVGFPGETDAQFEKLLNFTNEIKFDRLGVFTYSQEDGTPAAAMERQVPEAVKLHRQDRLLQTQQQVSAQKNQGLLGQTTEAIIDANATEIQVGDFKHAYIGRIAAQAPEVDGKTILYSEKPVKIGEVIHARIDGANAYDIFAKILQ